MCTQTQAVGRHRQVFGRQRGEPFDDGREVFAQRGLATGELEVGHADIPGGGGHRDDVVGAQQVLMIVERHAVVGHAVDAAQVAAVGEGQPQQLDRLQGAGSTGERRPLGAGVEDGQRHGHRCQYRFSSRAIWGRGTVIGSRGRAARAGRVRGLGRAAGRDPACLLPRLGDHGGGCANGFGGSPYRVLVGRSAGCYSGATRCTN